MARKIQVAKGQVAPGTKEAGETGVVNLTLPRELAWRLGVLSRMREIPLGRMCEGALWDVVAGHPLPWDRYRREAEERGRQAQADATAAQAGGQGTAPGEGTADREGIPPVIAMADPEGGANAADEAPAPAVGGGEGRKDPASTMAKIRRRTG